MSMPRRVIDRIVKIVCDGPVERIAVVLCSNGRYGIARNDVLIDSLEWAPHQLNQAIEFAERFARTNHHGYETGEQPTASA